MLVKITFLTPVPEKEKYISQGDIHQTSADSLVFKTSDSWLFLGLWTQSYIGQKSFLKVSELKR